MSPKSIQHVQVSYLCAGAVEARQGTRPPRIGVEHDWEPPDMGTNTQTWSYARAASILKDWAIPPAPQKTLSLGLGIM